MPYKNREDAYAWVREWRRKNRDKYLAQKKESRDRKRGGPPEPVLKHGATVGGRTPEYRAWQAARERCRNAKRHNYHRYGGRGIECRFDTFQEFLAVVGPKPSPKHTLDRWPNPDGHYEPGNVRWATMKEQQNNKGNEDLARFGLPRS